MNFKEIITVWMLLFNFLYHTDAQSVLQKKILDSSSERGPKGPSDLASRTYYLKIDYTSQESGETLGEISKKFYGHDRFWQLIVQGNSDKLEYLVSKDTMIMQGETLVIPPASLCARVMDSTCLQILDDIRATNGDLGQNKFVQQSIKDKLPLSISSNIHLAISENDLHESIDQGEKVSIPATFYGIVQAVIDVSTTQNSTSLFWQLISENASSIKPTLSIQIINDTPDMLVNFKANLTSGILQNIPFLINPGDLGSLLMIHDITSPFQIKGFFTFSVASPVANPFIVGWKWNDSPLELSVGILGDIINSSSILNTLSIDEFLLRYNLDYSPGWVFKNFYSEHAVKVLIKPGLITIHLFTQRTIQLPGNYFYRIIDYKVPNYVFDVRKLFSVQYMSQGKHEQNFLLRLVNKPSSSISSAYIIFNRALGLALTAPNANTLTAEPLKAIQNPDYIKQLWYIENLYDVWYETFTIRNAAFPSSTVVTSTTGGNLLNWILQVNPTSGNRVYFDHITQFVELSDGQTLCIRKWRNPALVMDLWSDGILKHYIENVNRVQQFKFTRTDCNGQTAYQITEQGLLNSLVVDGNGQLKGISVLSPSSYSKWLIIPSADHYNLVYRIKNCGSGHYIVNPVDDREASPHTLSSTIDNELTLYVLEIM
jgi:hypothetical protein